MAKLLVKLVLLIILNDDGYKFRNHVLLHMLNAFSTWFLFLFFIYEIKFMNLWVTTWVHWGTLVENYAEKDRCRCPITVLLTNMLNQWVAAR